MKAKVAKMEIEGKEYPIAFTLNVMSDIQDEYGTIQKWGELTEGKKGGECNVKALIFGLTAMINEGIEIENEEKGEKRSAITTRQLGRIINAKNMQNIALSMNDIVADSSKVEEKNA